MAALLGQLIPLTGILSLQLPPKGGAYLGRDSTWAKWRKRLSCSGKAVELIPKTPTHNTNWARASG